MNHNSTTRHSPASSLDDIDIGAFQTSTGAPSLPELNSYRPSSSNALAQQWSTESIPSQGSGDTRQTTTSDSEALHASIEALSIKVFHYLSSSQ